MLGDAYLPWSLEAERLGAEDSKRKARLRWKVPWSRSLLFPFPGFLKQSPQPLINFPAPSETFPPPTQMAAATAAAAVQVTYCEHENVLFSRAVITGEATGHLQVDGIAAAVLSTGTPGSFPPRKRESVQL